jgi:transketolase
MVNSIASLTDTCRQLRRQVLEMIVEAKKGHIGGSLSSIEILASLYLGGAAKVSPNTIKSPARDRVIFSKGHAVEALYAVLAKVGFFEETVLKTYGQNGSPLGGHPDCSLPGVEVSTGSLGHGLGVGAGLALAARKRQSPHRIFVVLGDGECYEGSIWEAAQFAAHHHLNNLVAIVDRNRQITLDDTEDCNAFEPFADKWRAFGWRVHEVDGHDIDALLKAFEQISKAGSEKPAVILAKTTKGKGISYMEKEVGWHHRVPKGAQVGQAQQDLSVNHV